MRENRKEKNERTARFWNDHLEKWSISGLSQSAYCRENNLKPNRFGYWKRKLKKQNCPVELVQISPQKIEETISLPSQNNIQLIVESGFKIEIPDGFSEITLTKLLHVLRGF